MDGLKSRFLRRAVCQCHGMKDHTKGAFDHQFLSKRRFSHQHAWMYGLSCVDTITSRYVSILYQNREDLKKFIIIPWMYLNISSNRIKDYLVIFECFPVTKRQITVWHIPPTHHHQGIVADKGN